MFPMVGDAGFRSNDPIEKAIVFSHRPHAMLL
jgi:hypothetical protein